MRTQEIAREYRLTQWARIMEERQASGQNIREFCKAAGYQEHVYYYWQRKLREAACGELQPPQVRSSTLKAVVPNGWAACTVHEDEAGRQDLAVEIGDCRVIVQPGVDSRLLAQVCRVLATL
jgi:putative transposase